MWLRENGTICLFGALHLFLVVISSNLSQIPVGQLWSCCVSGGFQKGCFGRCTFKNRSKIGFSARKKPIFDPLLTYF